MVVSDFRSRFLSFLLLQPHAEMLDCEDVTICCGLEQEEQNVYREREADHSESKLRFEVCEPWLEVDESVFARTGANCVFNGQVTDEVVGWSGSDVAGDEEEEAAGR